MAGEGTEEKGNSGGMFGSFFNALFQPLGQVVQTAGGVAKEGVGITASILPSLVPGLPLALPLLDNIINKDAKEKEAKRVEAEMALRQRELDQRSTNTMIFASIAGAAVVIGLIVALKR